jgi:hypothetical protein
MLGLVLQQDFFLPRAEGLLITLMMEAACTSETSVDIDLRAWQYIPEDSEVVDLLTVDI